MPARFTWFFGLYPSQVAARLLTNAHDWPQGLPSFTQRLQQAGYRTALVGKLHSLAGLYRCDLRDRAAEVLGRGFDDVVEVSGKSLANWFDCDWTEHLRQRGLLDQYRDELKWRGELTGGIGPHAPTFLKTADTADGFIAEQATAWLQQREPNRPFFLHVSFCGPHFPVDPPKAFFDRYDPRDMPAPEGHVDPARIDGFRKRRAAYCGLVEQIDQHVGELLDTLARQDALENTAVIFTTDHGDMLGHHGRTDKARPEDTSCRTPVIIRYPRAVPPGRTLDGMVEAVDLPCTILDAAGAWTPDALPGTPGRSFWPYVQGRREEHRNHVYSECGLPPSGWRMCRSRDWKYVIWDEGGQTLFSMGNDPWEQQNLAEQDDQQARPAEMRYQMLHSHRMAIAPNRDAGPPSVER